MSSVSGTDTVELKKFVKQLQVAVSEKAEADIVNILTILKKDFDVTEQVLRESKAGLAVGKLRTHEAATVSNLAKEIVKKWKTAVDKQKHANGQHSTSTIGSGGQVNGKPDRRQSLTMTTTPTTPISVASKGAILRSAKMDGVSGDTGDKTRDKCVELIYDALASDSGAPIDLVFSRAQAVEKSVFKSYNNNLGSDYRNKIRSLFVNLKDKNNPSLRESVVSGELKAEKFAVMTSDEMASEERKAADQKIKAENFHNSLAAEEQQAETDAFQCSRCKERKCRYRQAQTRSADEPMTTFVTCTNCGNKWKFS